MNDWTDTGVGAIDFHYDYGREQMDIRQPKVFDETMEEAYPGYGVTMEQLHQGYLPNTEYTPHGAYRITDCQPMTCSRSVFSDMVSFGPAFPGRFIAWVVRWWMGRVR